MIAFLLLTSGFIPSAIAATERDFLELRLLQKEVDMSAIRCAISWHQFKLQFLMEKEALKSLVKKTGHKWDKEAEKQYEECLKNTLTNLEILLSNEAKTQEVINGIQDELRIIMMPDL